MILQRSRAVNKALSKAQQLGEVETHIIMLILGEQGKPLLQEYDELVGHLIQLAKVAVGVDVAETGADGIVDKHDVGKLVPRAIIVDKRVLVFQSIGTNFHQGAVLGATTRATIQPDDGSLFVRNVFVLEVPEEEVTIAFGCDFNVTRPWRISNREGVQGVRLGKGSWHTQHASSAAAQVGRLEGSEQSNRLPKRRWLEPPIITRRR